MSATENPSPVTAPYGSWASPLSAELLSSGRVSFGDLRSVDGQIYWTETVPSAGGISSLFRMGNHAVVSAVSPEKVNVRTRVHEYGGAPYVVADDTVYYTQYTDQRLYALKSGSAHAPIAVTPAGYRYADCTVLRNKGGRAEALICVREDHSDPNDIRNAIVRLNLPLAEGGGAGQVLFADSDFVAYPRVSADGRHLAFITWSHPNMPWDATQLKVAELSVQGLKDVLTVSGSNPESVLEPQWDHDGTLYFISDRGGYWNLYAYRGGSVRPVWQRAAEFAGPLWNLGQSNYVLLGEGRAVARFGERGLDHLTVVNLKKGTAQVLDLPYVEFSHLTRLDSGHVAAVAGSAKVPSQIVRIDVGHGKVETLRSAGRAPLSADSVSTAEPIDFPSEHGRRSHAFYYAPTNSSFRAPQGTLPPLIAFVHGGPTAQASPAYSSKIQFWTSRGIAVVDVNYGGSSGYGREYRQALNGNWGVVDVEDVIAAAKYLDKTGRADPARTAISGGSAGGYTVLVALSTSDVFRAGADYYGVSDMTALAHDTHKFESRYLDSLIGPLPAAQSVYDNRSPLHHLDGFKTPLIVFQGAEDPIVPPNQSEKIVTALRARGVPLAYLLYPGESHGFRKPENVTSSLQAELSFYGQVFGFTPADKLPELRVEHLKPSS